MSDKHAWTTGDGMTMYAWRHSDGDLLYVPARNEAEARWLVAGMDNGRGRFLGACTIERYREE